MQDNTATDALRYVPQRSMEAVYVQRRIGPTPFGSALKSEPSDSAQGSSLSGSNVVSALASDQTHEKMNYRMNYPMCVVRGGPIFPQDTVRCVPPSRSALDPNQPDPRVNPMQIRPNVLNGPKPNPHWQKPPPADALAEERAVKALGLPNYKHPLPRDTLHPLISGLQAEANKIARELHPESGMLSNAKRTATPCNAHLHAAVQVGALRPGSTSPTSGSSPNNATTTTANATSGDHSSMTRPTTAGSTTSGASGSQDDNSLDGLHHSTSISVSGGKQSGGVSGANRRRPHDQRDSLGRGFAPDGCLKNASEYSDNIQQFASSMPTSLTSIAAKALGRALHEQPVTTVPALVKQKPLAIGSGSNSNESLYQINSMMKKNQLTLPPSPSFRNMNSVARSILSNNRSRDTRNLLEKIICETVPLSGPAPNELTQLMEDTLRGEMNNNSSSNLGSGGGAGTTNTNTTSGMFTMPAGLDSSIMNTNSSVGGGTTATCGAASHLRADEVEIGELLRIPIDLSPLWCAGSPLHAWDLATASLRGAALSSSGNNSNTNNQQDENNNKSDNNKSATTASLVIKKLRNITTQSASLFSSATSRPKLVQFLTDVGIRTGDSLYQILAPSQSDFTRQPERAQNLRQFGNTSETPGNTYGFDNGRFSVLLEQRGFDIEDASLNGATFLDSSTIRLFGQYSPFLRLFDVSGCLQLSGSDIATALTRSRQYLRLLNISWIDNITCKDMDNILPNLSNLVTLSMSGLNRLNSTGDYCFQHLCNMKQLRVLDVSFCQNLGDGAIVCAAQGCPSLEYIDMRGCHSLTDAAAAAIASYCSQLRCWRLSYCTKLTSASLVLLTRVARKLEVLSVDGMSPEALSEQVLSQAIIHGNHLASLSLAGTSNAHLSDESLVTIVRRCPNLQTLDISGGRQFSIHALTDLIHELKKLRRLTLNASSLSRDQTSLLRKVKQTVEIVDFEGEKKTTNRVFGMRAPPPPPPPKKKPGQKR